LGFGNGTAANRGGPFASLDSNTVFKIKVKVKVQIKVKVRRGPSMEEHSAPGNDAARPLPTAR